MPVSHSDHAPIFHLSTPAPVPNNPETLWGAQPGGDHQNSRPHLQWTGPRARAKTDVSNHHLPDDNYTGNSGGRSSENRTFSNTGQPLELPGSGRLDSLVPWAYAISRA